VRFVQYLMQSFSLQCGSESNSGALCPKLLKKQYKKQFYTQRRNPWKNKGKWKRCLFARHAAGKPACASALRRFGRSLDLECARPPTGRSCDRPISYPWGRLEAGFENCAIMPVFFLLPGNARMNKVDKLKMRQALRHTMTDSPTGAYNFTQVERK